LTGAPRDGGGVASVPGNAEGLRQLPAGVRLQRLIEFLRDRVASILGLDPDKVDPDRRLLTLGLDSLTAMELKVDLEASLGAAPPLSMLLEGSGIRELAERTSELLAGSATRPPEPSPAPASEEPDQRLSHGQQLLWYAHQF